MDESQKDPVVVLKEKMVKEIEGGHPYEALQLAESYVARKKKILGRSKTSSLVFSGCTTLLENSANADAGTLLAWFIEDGAGDDYFFKFGDDSQGSEESYCDVQRLNDLLGGLSPADAYPVVEKVYGPIHKAIVKKNLDKGSRSLVRKLEILENLCIDIFEATKNWFSAYKAIVRMGDMSRAARVLNSWAQEGYPSEHPLFFARGIFQLLSDGHLAKANQLLRESQAFVVEDLTTNPADSIQSGSLAVWHVATILAELSVMEERARVDKVKIFNIITSKYTGLILKIDPKIVLLFEKIGQNAFGVRPPNADAPNPMAAMLQGMFSGGAPALPPAPASKGKGKKGKGGGTPDIFDMSPLKGALRK